MPISLSQLTANRKACSVTFDGVGALHVEYFPQRLTAKMLASVTAADAESLKAMAPERVLAVVSSPVEILATLLASWDLTAEDGGPVLPIDRETLDGLGLPVLWAILSAIMADGNSAGEASAPAGPAKKQPSGAGS